MPSRCRRSKKNGESSTAALSSEDPSLPKRLIVSWNARGRPSSSSARVSPSSTKARPGSARTCATSSGTPAVISRSVRVQTRTSSPSRCTWMRAPSSLYSTVTSGPRPASAASSESPGEASIGRTGLPTCRVTAASAGSPPSRARRAVSGRRPDSMKARRTTAAGTSAAAATASSITPSSAPWRSSPPSSVVRKRCSSRVAAANRPCSSSARRLVEPAPAVAASASSVVSTASTVSVGSAAGGASMPGERAPAGADAALPRLARQPRGGGLDLGGRGRAEQGRERRRLGRAGARGPDGRGGGDDLGEQHRPILASTTDNAREPPHLGRAAGWGRAHHADRATPAARACSPRGRHPPMPPARLSARRATPPMPRAAPRPVAPAQRAPRDSLMMSACPACWAVSCRRCRSTSRAFHAASGGYQGASGSL